MRICYVADGSSIHTERWVNYFASKGHEVHLVCWKLVPGYGANVHIHLLSRLLPKIWAVSKYLSALLWIFQTRRFIRKIEPDIVDGHFVTVYGFLAACSGFHPLIVSAWGSDVLVQPKGNPLSKFTARYAANNADIVICLFPIDIAKESIARLGIDADKVRTVLLGVDTAEFDPSRRDNRIRETLGIEQEQPVVISTRALAPIYNVETLVRAIPLVLTEIPQAKFMIAGTGKEEGHLKGLARAQGVSNSTKFLGWVPRTELPRYLSSADVYVSTSLSDGTSNALLEAMACGMPPVVTDIPANRPWIDDGENGFLFPAGDYKTLASKIVYMLSNEEVRKDFGVRSRVIVQKKAEQQTEMEKIDSIYTELIKGG